MARARHGFTTLRTEGGLLPSGVLQRVAAKDKSLDALTPAAYHLADGETFNERIERAWSRARALWQTFSIARSKLGPDDPATSLTREKWLLPLFEELGFGRLQAAAPVATPERAFAISHGWQSLPIHLVAINVDLDTRAQGVPGASRASPHGLMQEALNKSDAHLWGIVSNGRALRLLRDHAAMTRQAFVEFDLETMLEGEHFADFALLWLTCHQSRFEGKPEDFVPERWSRAGAEFGVRALDHLREGVTAAITALGAGFLAARANNDLRAALKSGSLDTQEYYRELLRLAYRLIFLFVAEDRELLHPPKSAPEACDRYGRWYSTLRLREVARSLRGSRHGDQWQIFRHVALALGRDGMPQLALPALGGFLWSETACPHLDASELDNASLLEAVRQLAFQREGRVLFPTDWRNLGSEELGSVYESLLELHPRIHADAGQFELGVAAGHERKTSGSYYTPSSLIQCLLDSALDPVLDEAAKSKDPAQALLGLKICDPACGSGHFLVAAAHRIARRLARARTGEEEPSPDAYRTALRDVIGHCIHGVDLNPMAVELCKVSLWMEALEPGKPLSFLDHRIRCGNSLLGTTPALIAKGIPDEAFEPLEGDDKAVTRDLKKRNKLARQGQGSLFTAMVVESDPTYGVLGTAYGQLDALEDSQADGVRAKARRHAEIESSAEYRAAKLVADAWCAAFMWRKTTEFPDGVTQDVLAKLSKAPAQVPAAPIREVERLAAEYQFFHWHLAFPGVFRVGEVRPPDNPIAGWSGGFDVLLGNPPWDTLSPDAKEFFSTYDPQIRFQSKSEQDETIARLESEPLIRTAWMSMCRSLYSQVHFFKQSGRYELFAPGNLGKGDFNVYRMFVETGMLVVRRNGRLAQFVPENLYNGANAMALRRCLLDAFQWDLLLGFENAREVWFTDIDTRMKFCLYVGQKSGRTEAIHAAFNIRSHDELRAAASGKTLRLPVSLIEEFSPDALAVMELSSQLDVDIASRMYAAWPKFGDESAGPPHREYMAEIHMGNDRDRFSEDQSGLPLYEGRMIDAFDHRAKAYRSGRGRAAEWEEVPFGDARKAVVPQWYVSESMVPSKLGDRPSRYRIGFCDVASPTNERALAAALIPPDCLCGDKVPTINFEDGWEWAYMVWLAVANSFAMDFIARKKISLKMSYTVMDSLPFPRLAREHPAARRTVELAARLTCTSSDMHDYWELLASDGWLPASDAVESGPGIIDEELRAEARAELDAIVARELFHLTRDELAHILDTFPIVRGRDEKAFGSFRTKSRILERFDEYGEVEWRDRERAGWGGQ